MPNVWIFAASIGLLVASPTRTLRVATGFQSVVLPHPLSWMETATNNERCAGRSALNVLDKSVDGVPTANKEIERIHQETAIGLYVHIPYCRRRCRYCNFAIVPIGPNAMTEGDAVRPSSSSSSFLEMDRNYTTALLKEFHNLLSSQTRTLAYKIDSAKVPLRSVYFGGGTPSLAPTETLRKILSAIMDPDRSPFSLDLSSAEITIEMDPGTFSKEKLAAIKTMGFNRISLGVQSFDDRILESLGRVHRYKDIVESLAMLDDVFGRHNCNYSIDLISGVPGLSCSAWVETLHKAVNLMPRPAHLSIYDLQIERGTVFGTWYDESIRQHDESVRHATFHSTKGEAPVSREILRLPSEEDTAFMYKFASAYLRRKDYEHYEVSSYALLKPGDESLSSSSSFRSQHNQIYWALDSQWYAIGMGASSYVNGRILARPRTLADYRNWVDGGGEAGKERAATSESDGDNVSSSSSSSSDNIDLLLDTVLKRLRTSEGLSLDWVQKRFGDAHVQAILQGSELGLDLGLAVHIPETNTVRLIDPNGFLYSNSIISSIFVELEAL